MSADEIIRAYMTAAGVLMEDASARMLLEPLHPGRVSELRQIAADLLKIADVVEAVRRVDQ